MTTAAVTAAAMGLAACGSSGDGGGVATTSAKQDTSTPVKALDVQATVLTSDVGDTMPDPMQDYLENFWGDSEFLLKPKAGGTEPWVAKGVDRVDDLTWRITLRPDVTFQNGHPVDAAAVVRWLKYEMEQDEYAKQGIGSPTSIAAEGDLAVVVRTKKPYEAFRNGLASYTLPVIDVAVLKPLGKDYNGIAGKGIYTGPFALQSIKPGVREYARNENYWDGPVALKGFTLRKSADPQSALRAVQAGEAQISLTPPPKTSVAAKGSPNVRFNVSDESAVFVAAVPYARKAPFDDVKVRQAFALAVDNDTIAKTATFGLFRPLKGIFPSDSPYASDWKRFDVDEAGRLLGEAGWTAGADGVRAKDGRRLSITLYTYSDLLEDVATGATATLRAAGFDAKVTRVQDYSDLEKPIADKGGVWVGNVESFGLDGNPVTSFARNYLKPPEGGKPTILNVLDDGILAQVDALVAASDEQEIQTGMQELGRLNGEGAYYVPIVEEPNTLLVAKDYAGLRPDPFYLFLDARTAPSS